MHSTFTKYVSILRFCFIFLFHTVTRTLKLGIDVVTGIVLMSDGSLVSYGHGREYDRRGYTYTLCQHNLETEKLIYSKEMKTTGAIEIIFDDKPTLLLSNGLEEFFTIVDAAYFNSFHNDFLLSFLL